MITGIGQRVTNSISRFRTLTRTTGGAVAQTTEPTQIANSVKSRQGFFQRIVERYRQWDKEVDDNWDYGGGGGH